MVGVNVAADLIQPCAEAGSRRVGVPVFEHAQEGVLRQVLTQRAVPGEVEEVSNEAGMVTIEEHLEAPYISILDLGHHCFIWGCHFSLLPLAFTSWNTSGGGKGYEC